MTRAILLTLALTAPDDGPLTIADLAAYRAALEPSKEAEVAQPVTFRDLWDRPGEHRGQRVAVEGRVMSVFHQAARGQFPALAETWIFTPAFDPFCLVFPEGTDGLVPKPGALVQFTGTFLRRVRYQSGNVERLAPLVVGPEPPRVEPSAPAPVSGPSGAAFDGMFVLVMGGIVVLALLRVHLRRPAPLIAIDPPPEFRDRPPIDWESSDRIS